MSAKRKPSRTRACLIVSARSGSGTFDAEAAIAVLSAQGWEIAVREKHDKGEAVELARRAAEDGFDPIVNCGGDGTLNEIVTALVGTDVALGVLPGGTVNVWPRQIGVSERTRVAATQLVTSQRMKIDVGQVDVAGATRHFLMMAGLGIDGAVMDRTSRSLKQRVGQLAVGAAVVQSLPTLRPQAVRMELDDVHWEGMLSQAVFGNTRLYGGFASVTPDAWADDGLLDVCLFTTDGVRAAGRQVASLLLHRRPSAASSENYRVARAVVRTDSPWPLEVDGSAIDVPGSGSVEYVLSVRPRALKVVLPRTYDGAVFTRRIPASKGKHSRGEKPDKHST